MKNNASFRGDFKYICGEIFAITINNEIAGKFEITKCNPTKNTYTLKNLDEYCPIESIVVNRMVFEIRAKKAFKKDKFFVELEIYDFDDTSSIKYRDENEQGLIK